MENLKILAISCNSSCCHGKSVARTARHTKWLNYKNLLLYITLIFITGCSDSPNNGRPAIPRPIITLTEETLSYSTNPNPSFLVSNVENGHTVTLHTDSACRSKPVASSTASNNTDATLEDSKTASEYLGKPSDNSVKLTLKFTLITGLTTNGYYTYYAKQVSSSGRSSPCSNPGVVYEFINPLSPEFMRSEHRETSE